MTRFIYQGHDAGGAEKSGQVDANSMEEAAEVVRKTHKVYARSITPAKVQPQAVDHRAEAARLVRQQADIQDGMAQGKMHVYVPQEGQANADPSQYCKPEPKKQEMGQEDQYKGPDDWAGKCDQAKEYAWEQTLRDGLDAADKVADAMKTRLPHEIVERLRMELIKTAATSAWQMACRS